MADFDNNGVAADEAVDLVGLLKPLKPIRFATGHVCEMRRATGDGWKLYKASLKAGTDAAAMKFLKWVIPDATEDDFASMDEDGEMFKYILGQTLGKSKTLLALAGNADAGAAPEASPPRPSNRPMKRTTSSPALPQPSAPIG